MNQILKAFLHGLFLLSILTGCKEFEGELKATKSFSLVNENSATITLGNRSYDAEIKVRNKREFQLVLDLPDRSEKIIFKTRTKLSQIKSGDQISISSNESGQPVDLQGVYNSVQSQSGINYTYEQCDLNNELPRCGKVLRPGCVPQNAPVRLGQRQIEFYNVYTTDTIQLSVLKNSEVVGSINVKSVDTDKIILHSSACMSL